MFFHCNVTAAAAISHEYRKAGSASSVCLSLRVTNQTAGLWQQLLHRRSDRLGSGCCQTVFCGTAPSYHCAKAWPVELPLIQTSSPAAEASLLHDPQWWSHVSTKNTHDSP